MRTRHIIWLFLGVVAQHATAVPFDLRTGHSAPGAVVLAWDSNQPLRLSWKNKADASRPNSQQQQQQQQTSFAVTVHAAHGAAPVFHSGIVTSREQEIELPAGLLAADTDFWWSVNTSLGNAPSQSAAEPLKFSTAPATLGAYWIGGVNQLRSDLTLDAANPPVRARVHVSGLGAFALWVNGRRVGDHFMDPPQTVYPYRVLYSTFDLLPLLRPGHNAVGAMLGNYKWGYLDVWCDMTRAGGPNGCRAFTLVLLIELADGSRLRHATEPHTAWQCRQGPVLWDHLFHGESYDARNVVHGWANRSLADLQPAKSGRHPWGPCRVMATQNASGVPGGAHSDGRRPLGPLRPSQMPPLRVVETFGAVTMTALTSSRRWVFDFAQNVAGTTTLRLPAGHGLPEGSRVRIEHAEILHSGLATRADIFDTYCRLEGAVGHPLRHEPCAPHPGRGHEIPDRYIGDWNAANQTNEYVVADPVTAVEYTPLFAAAGFRYAALSVHPDPPPGWAPALGTLVSNFVHSDVRTVGHLQLPSMTAEGAGTSVTPDLLRRIHAATRYSSLANLWSIPTDCPQRERRGWTGDAQLSSEQAMLQFDMQGFYTKYLLDLRHDQLYGCEARNGCGGMDPALAAGSIADVVPFDTIGPNPGTPVWQLAYVVLVRNMWRHYADRTAVITHWLGLTALMAHLRRRVNTTSGLLDYAGHGDWICVGPNGPGQRGVPGNCLRTPPQITCAFQWTQALRFMGELAVVARRPQAEADSWMDQHHTALAAFHSRFFSVGAGGYAPTNYSLRYNVSEPRGSQTSNALALVLGATESAPGRADNATALALDALVQNVGAHSMHPTFGIIGSAWTFRALSQGGRGDLALRMLLTDTFPSFGAMIAQNMTTLCEDWTCTAHSPQAEGVAASRSLNHIMYGGFHSWLLTRLGGMDTVSNTSSSGWRHFRVEPDPHAVVGLRSGGLSVITRFGRTSVFWAYDVLTGRLHTNVTVPSGSEAIITHSPTLPRAWSPSTPATVDPWECSRPLQHLVWSQVDSSAEDTREDVEVWSLTSSDEIPTHTIVRDSGIHVFVAEYGVLVNKFGVHDCSET